MYPPHISLTGFFTSSLSTDSMLSDLNPIIANSKLPNPSILDPLLTSHGLIVPISHPPFTLSLALSQSLAHLNVRSKKSDHISLAYFNNRFNGSLDLPPLFEEALLRFKVGERVAWDVVFYCVELSLDFEKVWIN